MDFENLDYLKNGNTLQKQVFEVLGKYQIMDLLQEFDPILVGTFPININIENSDLDIICYWKNKSEFISYLKNQFQKHKKFSIEDQIHSDRETIVSNFIIDGFEVEIFTQNIPTKSQYAYRHLLIEHEILNAKGENFRQQIIKLKKEGFKTEPAFCKLLGIDGNPYENLLHYKSD